MPVTLRNTDILFNDGSTQSTAATGSFTGPNFQFFSASGTFTVPAGITKLQVYAAGGGGGGNSSAYPNARDAGGHAGAGIIMISGLSPGASITVTVGSGGAGNGSAGGTTSFGSYITCTGGAGGVSVNTPSGRAAQGTTTVSGATTIFVTSTVSTILSLGLIMRGSLDAAGPGLVDGCNNLGSGSGGGIGMGPGAPGGGGGLASPRTIISIGPYGSTTVNTAATGGNGGPGVAGGSNGGAGTTGGSTRGGGGGGGGGAVYVFW